MAVFARLPPEFLSLSHCIPLAFALHSPCVHIAYVLPTDCNGCSTDAECVPIGCSMGASSFLIILIKWDRYNELCFSFPLTALSLRRF